MSNAVEVEAIYQRRFGPDLAFRQRTWRVLCGQFFQRFVPRDSTVLEVGAGYCEFINNIVAAHKIAVDLNPDTHLLRQRGCPGDPHLLDRPLRCGEQLRGYRLRQQFLRAPHPRRHRRHHA